MKRLLTLLIFLTSVHINLLKASDALPEYTLKAAYLYNFALLTDWPSQKQDTEQFNVCLYAKESLGPAFDALQNKHISHKPIKIHYLSATSQAQTCHLIFIPKIRQGGIEKILRQVTHLPILLVSDDEEFSAAHIQILHNHDKLIFTIDTKLLEEIGLNLSSRLLNLAKEIKR